MAIVSVKADRNGYAAAQIAVGGDQYLEIQIYPDFLKVKLCREGSGESIATAHYHNQNAILVGRQFCATPEVGPIFADALEDVEPDECNRGFDPPKYLRAGIAFDNSWVPPRPISGERIS